MNDITRVLLGRFTPHAPESVRTSGTGRTTARAEGRAPLLHVVRYQTFPYEAGKSLQIRMFIDNAGSEVRELKGGTRFRFIDTLPPDREARRMLENSLWSDAETNPGIIENNRTSIPVLDPGSFFMEMHAGPVSQAQIDQLAKDSAMYLFTLLRGPDGHVVIESCIYTSPTRDSVLFCVEHNSDETNQRSRAVLDRK